MPTSLPRPHKPRIFLSYAKEDAEKVRVAYSALAREDFDPWFDIESLRPGQEWKREIQAAIRAADFVVVFLSSTSVRKRGYVQAEIRLTLETLAQIPRGRVFVIPARLEECAVPDELQEFQFCELFRDGMPALIAAIEAAWVERTAAIHHDSQRGALESHGEIHALTKIFRGIFDEIHPRDHEINEAHNRRLARAYANLQASEERFRQLVENICAFFWMTDAETGEMIYASPGYEVLWGRSVASLYRNPRKWLEVVHPDDQERVRAALPRQIIGDYDIEYRVVRPDGSLRWIHDRAFPIHNALGNVYRLAGIAEGITSRKH